MTHKFDFGGHKFTNYYYGQIWIHCSNCKVIAYINLRYELQYWPDDPFHTKLPKNRKLQLTDFNYSCNEFIIKSIIE